MRTEIGLEDDLLVVSAADAERDDPLFRDGTAAFEHGGPTEQAEALAAHADSVLAHETGCGHLVEHQLSMLGSEVAESMTAERRQDVGREHVLVVAPIGSRLVRIRRDDLEAILRPVPVRGVNGLNL